MSAHYDLMPLSQILSTPKGQSWLRGMGLIIPNEWEASRNPTAEEVRSVARHLVEAKRLVNEPEFHPSGGDLDAVFETGLDATDVSVEDFTKDHRADTPRHVSFQYGSPELVLTICECLAHICGPFLLTQDGACFIIVNEGTSPDADWVVADF